jgi:hypothetical protein
MNPESQLEAAVCCRHVCFTNERARNPLIPSPGQPLMPIFNEVATAHHVIPF